MAEPKNDFTPEEYQQRIRRTRAAMAEKGLDLIVVSDPSNMHWLTGYDGWSFYVHQAVLLGMEGEPVWWGRGIDEPGAKRTVTMADENIVGYTDIYVQNPEMHPMETLAAQIRERGWGSARGSASNWTTTTIRRQPTSRW
jgi:ectoine hydrolase